MARLKLQHGSKRPNPPRQKKRDRVVLNPRKQKATFLPDNEHLVKMIAMQGADDDEIADMFGVDRDHFQAWRKMYPGFAKAISDGRTSVDAEVTYKLYQQTQGFKYTEQTATPKGGIVEVERYARPDTSAIKYWLENRAPQLWRTASTHRLAGGGKGEDPIGMKVESRNDLIDTIVSMLSPKPDGITKPSHVPELVKR